MDAFNLVTGIASVLGLCLSGVAAFQAGRARKAATAARDAVTIRTLSDELQLACKSAEQLVDFLVHSRFGEATLRSDELVYTLSELPFRRGGYLGETQLNTLLTCRQQVQTISDAMAGESGGNGTQDHTQSALVARRVAISLREVLGHIRSMSEGEAGK